MKHLLISIAGAAIAIAACEPAWAQASPSQPVEPVTRLEDLEVRETVAASDMRRRVDDFVRKTMAPPHGRPLARWGKPVCIGAAYFKPDIAQGIIDQLALRILEVGGEVAGPGCTADVLVIGSTDGAATARQMVGADSFGFRPAGASTDRGSASLVDFQTGEDAVRWWHVSIPVSVETGEVAIVLHGEEAPTLNVGSLSHLRTNVRDEIKRVIVILDLPKIPPKVRLEALIDYVAFVVLAQVDPKADASQSDSILSLFTAASPPNGWTAWDVEYLSALYKADPSLVGMGAQNRAIASQIMRQRRSD